MRLVIAIFLTPLVLIGLFIAPWWTLGFLFLLAYMDKGAS